MQFGGNDGRKAIHNDGGNERGTESNTQGTRTGLVGSMLETPLLQGSGDTDAVGFRDAERFGDVCVEFRQTGACEFGDRCHFLHVT